MAKKQKHKDNQPRFRAIAVILSVAVIGAVLITQSSAATTTGVYSGVFAGGNSSLADVHGFEDISGKKVSIVNSFSSWGAADNTLKVNMLNNVRSNGSVPMITWEPWNTANGVNQPEYSLKSIINGDHDAYIKSWAKSVKDWNGPVFLRFAHEMNGNWYPWSEQVNGNSQGEYVQAWKHVQQLFKNVGANKVTWVWCVNKIYSGSADIQSLYPGDPYVDWTSFDAYNRGTATGATGNQYAAGTWQNFGTLVKPTYQAINQIAPGKPQMLAEFGTVEEGGDKADWFTKALKYELKANYPRIKAIVYFNIDKVYDNRIESTPASQTAYKEGIGLSYYSANDMVGVNGKVYPLLFDAQPTDITGPFASIIGPYASTLPRNIKRTITVRATDRSGVAKVEFFVNGQLLCSDARSGYGCAWVTPNNAGPVTVSAITYDKLGNSSTTTATYQIK